MQKDSQEVLFHPSWKGKNLREINSAWYQREITIPGDWAGRRIFLDVEYINSYAAVFVDGKKAGEIRFPAAELDLGGHCVPGRTYALSLLVIAMPLKGVELSFNDTASAREVKGSVPLRGLCGDVFLVSRPSAAHIGEVKVEPSVRKRKIGFRVGLSNLDPGDHYTLKARIMDGGALIRQFSSSPITEKDLRQGRVTLTEKWIPEKLWDIHTPGNQYDVEFSLLDSAGKVIDTHYKTAFGVREFWIEGRDFFLNGSRIYLSGVPLDNAHVGAALATYEAAKESMLRLKSFGINMVYTHNYGCLPGSHLGFSEILKAADDVGMLVSLSQPHFGHYEWDAKDVEATNGYAKHAEFYASVAGNHPSVVMYSMSHNATGYTDDMNPDMIDGIYSKRNRWAAGNMEKALRAEAIVSAHDSSRIVYHHASGNLGSMHTSNFYPNFAPIQEMSDWFEHWAVSGVKPLFTCEYAAPFSWDWTMYRGWYQGKRAFGSAKVPWEFCLAEWNAQFLGDGAFHVSEMEKANLRWEASKLEEGAVWHRWDYPYRVNSRDFDERYPVFAMYITDNWRAFRTWGVSAVSPWEFGHYWKLRDGVDKGRVNLSTDWENLQRPGFSPDYIHERYERMDLAYERSDWIPTEAARALIRNNGPLLAYIGGKPGAFTSKDHNFFQGETVEKQIIVINNSRVETGCEFEWRLGLPQALTGEKRIALKTGEQERIPLRFRLPETLAPGEYRLDMKARFGTGEIQEDSFAIHVLPRPPRLELTGRIALFDPKGETARLLEEMGIGFQKVDAKADLSGFDMLVIGKGGLTQGGSGPDVSGVRDGLKVIVFGQTAETLEKRLGFRVTEYGLRQVFHRVPDHPLLKGIGKEHLRDWRGEATLLPPRLSYEPSKRFNGAPAVKWCDIEVTKAWRCGCRGNVASVLIEKPAAGDFLPVTDGGFSLQYSPLMEFREGKGMVLFCQMDVTGRSDQDPAALTLLRNIFEYAGKWKPAPERKAFASFSSSPKASTLPPALIHSEILCSFSAGCSPAPGPKTRTSSEPILSIPSFESVTLMSSRWRLPPGSPT